MIRPLVELLKDMKVGNRVFPKGSQLRATNRGEGEGDKLYVVLMDDPNETRLRVGKHVKFV